MSRQPKLRLFFNEKSLLEHLQQMYMALNDRIAKCNRQITLLSGLIKSPSDALTLQNIMGNIEKSIATCQSQRIELIKIQKDVIATAKKEDKKKLETSDSLSEEAMIEMSRKFSELRKQKKSQEDEF